MLLMSVSNIDLFNVPVLNSCHDGIDLFQRLCFWIMYPSSALRHSIANQLRGSNRTIRSLYLAASFLQTPSQDFSVRSSATQGHLGYAGGLEKKLTTDLCSSPPSDIGDHLLAHLEVSLYLPGDLV
jgi:hypothetical protein